MKRQLFAAWLGGFLFVNSAAAQASAALGAAIYRDAVAYSELEHDAPLQGYLLFATLAPSNYLALRAGYFDAKHGGYPQRQSNGLEGVLLAGWNLQGQGLKLYLGIGGFQDMRRHGDGTSDLFYGHQFAAGAGYRYQQLSVDGWLTLRDARDYAAWLEARNHAGGTVTASAFSLGLSYYF